ncbi:MAG TPA: hypothetical protein PLN21_03885 [Gemmatales bacterium]|nr:hypothetical protein [Gemmatales bacterium]
MPQDANQPKGWRGDGNQPKRTAKYGWKPKSAGIEKSLLMRRGTQVSLALSVLMCMAVMVFLYLLWRPPEQTSIIIVAARPSADATDLRAPLDFHGWEGCQKLMRYVKDAKDIKAAEILPKDKDHLSLSDQNSLLELVTLVQNSKTSRVIVYFGLFGFAGEHGPCLFGSHGEIIQVSKIIEELGKVAGKGKDIVLLFDAARLPVAPELGVLRNDFVSSLKENLGEKIKNTNHLAVICSSSPEERAWNSDEWGCSVFLQQVIEALRGKAKGKSDDITLIQFFKTVEEETKRWTQLRFVSPQIPTLFCSDEMKSEKSPVIVTQQNKHEPLKDTEASNAPGYDWVVNADTHLEKLKKHYIDTSNLAKARPHPAVYTPVSWRRYRELLVRLEQAVRMNGIMASDTARKLDDELITLEQFISKSQALGFEKVRDTNTIWPIILAGKAEEVETADVFAGNTANLAQETFHKPFNSADPPPPGAELHLAYKLAQFWDKGSKPLPDTLKLAIETRQLAERAALGCPAKPMEYFYTERLWEWIQPELEKLDARRRIAEDYLFSDEHQKAVEDLNALKLEYQTLINKCLPLQKAWDVYHYAVSEASFLTKWHVFCAEELQDKDKATRLQELWREVHLLEENLRTIKLEEYFRTVNRDSTAKEMEEMVKRCREINLLMKTEMKDFLIAANDKIEKAAGSQIPRHQLELLLSFPWPIPRESDADNRPVADRVLAINKARGASRDLHKTEGPSNITPDPKVLDKIVQYRGELIKSMMQKVNPRSDSFPFDGGQKQAKELGKEIEAFWRMLAVEGAKEQKLDLADVNSRYALAFTAGTPVEVALNQRDARYRTLLREHAKRICRDHWYDETTAYFKATADKYLNNEGVFFIDPDKDNDPELRDLLKTDQLKWKPSTLERAWTSEPSREWPIEVENPLKKIEGRITLWAENGTETAIMLKEGGERRLSMPLNEARRTLTLEAKDASGVEKRKIDLAFAPKAYFRGQKPYESMGFSLNRQPSLIVTEHPMKEGGTFTLTKAKDLRLGLGHLAIVLDYSHSMRVSGEATKYNKDGKAIDWNWRREDSRIRQAIDGLDKLLKTLSDDVNEIDLSIHVFSEENEKTKAIQEKISFKEGDPLRSDKIQDLTQQIEITEMFIGILKKRGGKRVLVPHDNKMPELTLDEFGMQLQRLTPYSSTPLLKSMIGAVKPVRNKQNVTLLVLTDGADTSLGELEKTDDAKIDTLRKSFENEFFNSGLSINIILFTTDKDEKAIAHRQFKEFKSDTSSCVVKEAIDSQELLIALKDSFKARMEVFDKSNQAIHSKEKDSPPYFTAQKINSTIGELSISPLLTTGTYDSQVRVDKQLLSFFPGDHLFIKLENAPRGVKYKRELFKDVLPFSQPGPSERYIPGEIDGKKTLWHLTVAENLAPGHLRLTLEHEKHRVESSEGTLPVLSMYRPEFVWWDVKAVGTSGKEQPAQGTIHITKLPHYYAPGWDIDQIGTKKDEKLRFQAWVSENIIQKQHLHSFVRSELKKNNDWQKINNQLISVSCETHDLTNGSQPISKQVPCLVVRYRLSSSEQRVWFEKPTSSVNRSDHYYFPDAQTMTVFFSPFNPEGDPDEKLSLEMIDLDNFKQLKKPVVDTKIDVFKNWQGPPNLDSK